MPMTAFMKATGIKGSSRQKTREDEIPIIGFTHEIKTEINPANGEIGKTRHHTAFVIQKEVDLSTPAFHQHQTNGAAIPECEIRLFHMPKSGNEAHYFTITLTNAKVVFVKTVMPPAYEPANSNVHEYEEIGFEYSEISWQKIPISGPFASGNEHGSPAMKDKIGEGLFFTGGVFIPDWLDAQAKVAVLKMAAELKAAGFDYGKNLYQSTLLKMQGKPPAVEPAEDK